LGNDRGKISSLTLLLSCRLLQNYYPERLGKALMIHVPYIFMKAWKMIYPFIDTNTRDKVSVLYCVPPSRSMVSESQRSLLPFSFWGTMRK
jgi:hypothetical protein